MKINSLYANVDKDINASNSFKDKLLFVADVPPEGKLLERILTEHNDEEGLHYLLEDNLLFI